ncbi:hypothetical protein JW868_04110 [Candidatus Woesearchaeota archaeon]|nr:hypothetical protein [Candidatus Woesearchaeota archaeon]
MEQINRDLDKKRHCRKYSGTHPPKSPTKYFQKACFGGADWKGFYRQYRKD